MNDSLFARANALEQAGDFDAAGDAICSELCGLLRIGAIAACNDVLREVDDHDLSLALLLCVLMATAPLRASLPARAAVYAAALRKAAAKLSAADAQAALRGLE
jgi:hypothetical protein